MSKRINVNPGQYKVAGRERQGEDVVHSAERRTLARSRREERLIRPVPSKEANQPMAGSKSTRSTAAARGSKRQTTASRASHTGISNRESPDAEARERREHPPVRTSSPPPEDAAGRVGEQPLDDRRNRHTSHKAGSRSIAQKEAEARYPDRPMPAARKVAGAFGREPQRVAATSNERSGAMRRAKPKRAAKGKRKTR